MEDKDLQALWQAYDRKLEESRILNMQSWVLQLQSLEMIQSFKAKGKLGGLSRYKTIVSVIGLVWIWFVGTLVLNIPFHINPYFSISGGCVLLVNIVCIGGYLYHIILIASIRYQENITDTQKKLARLQTSTLGIIRIGWLQMPFYTTFFWHRSWVGLNPGFLFTALPVTLLFSWLAVYLYRNTTVNNLHKKWMQQLVGKSLEYAAMIKARAFMDEIDAFRENLQEGVSRRSGR